MRKISVEITSVAPRSGGDEFAVTFSVANDEGNAEQKSFIISAEQYILFSPKVGNSSLAECEIIERADEVFRATKKAIFLLGYGTCSKKRLCQKLCAKGFKKDVACEAVDTIEEKGFLDSVSDAEREAERCFEKSLGKRRIAAELFSKGYADTSVKKALEHLDEASADYVSSCASYVKKKYSAPPSSADELKKLYASLLRRGFTSDEIKKAINIAFKG